MFKECTKCKYIWDSREEFICDTGIELIGYQVHFQDLALGFFLFEHSCGTSLAIRAGEFRDFYTGQVFSSRKTNTADCSGYCLHEDNLETCPSQCECAYVREIMQILKAKDAACL